MIVRCTEIDKCRSSDKCEHATPHEKMPKWCKDRGCIGHESAKCLEMSAERSVISPTLQKKYGEFIIPAHLDAL